MYLLLQSRCQQVTHIYLLKKFQFCKKICPLQKSFFQRRMQCAYPVVPEPSLARHFASVKFIAGIHRAGTGQF